MKAQMAQINIKSSYKESYTSLDIKAGSILPANTGYRNTSYIIENSRQLVNIFGKPTSSNYKFWWNIYNYLEYSNKGIYVINPISNNDKNYSIRFDGSNILGNNYSTTNVYNKDLASNLIFNTDLTAYNMEIYNRYIENTNSLACTICSNESDWNESITDEKIDIIRDLNVYVHNERTEIYNNSYVIKFNEPTIIDLYNNKSGTDNHLVLEGNQTHIKVGEQLRVNDSTMDIVDKIESNNYRVEDTHIGFQYTITIGDITPAIGDEIIGNTSGCVATVHSIIGNSVILYDLENADFVDETLTIESVLSTTTITALDWSSSKTPIFILDEDHQYLEDDDIINLLDDENNYLISSHNYAPYKNTTNILTTKTVTSWNELTSVNTKVVIKSNTTSIILRTGTLSTINNVKYLGGEWNSNDYSLGGIDGSVLGSASNNQYLEWDNINSWKFGNITNKKYYVKNVNKVYEYVNPVFTELTINALEVNSNTAIKDIYDEKIIQRNVIKSYKDIFNDKPKFIDGEFALAVFTKNENNRYELKETYILKYDKKSEIEIYNNSNLIYIKLNSGSLVNTKTFSVEELTINVDETKDYSTIRHYTNKELNETSEIYLDKDYYIVDYLLGFKSFIDDEYNFDIMTNIAKERGNTIALNSVWEENKYFGRPNIEITKILTDNFGCQDFKYDSKIKFFSKYMGMFGNMKLQYDFFNDNYIWIPITGDIAGLFVDNETNTGVGYGNNLKNTIRLLFNIVDGEHKKELNRNGINLITYDNLSRPIIFDSITSTKKLDSIFRELQKRKTINLIKNDLRRFFFKQLLKVTNNERVNDINQTLENYLSKLHKNNKILNDYSKSIKRNGNTLEVNISFTFTDILRVVNISVIVNESGIKIREL
jgi:hypothetical protein